MSSKQEYINTDAKPCVAMELVAHLGLEKVEFLAVDLLKARYRDFYDLIIATDVLEQIPNPEATMENLHDLLQPVGTLLPSGLADAAVYKFGRWLFRKNKPDDH